MAKKIVDSEWGALAVDTPLTPTEIEAKVDGLLGQMTLADKVDQMTGDATPLGDGLEMMRAYNFRPIRAGENPRLGIPGIRFSDGPRGVVMNHSTCFPVAMARGASWDLELEERIGDAIGVEARSLGANYFGGVCINLLRHPAWGRAQETFGEDPYHLGEMGAALVRGVQRHIMACAKHYALNSIENARFKVDVRVDERTLREVYLPHFKRCVDEGVASIMSAYNKVNGQWCSHNAHLLREILKDEWGFDGFVLSDFVFALHDGRAAALGGLDVEMPFARHYGKKLHRLVERGEVPLDVIDEAVRRILRQKVRFAQIGEPGRYHPAAVASQAHRDLARESAQKSIVLLKNEPVPGPAGTLRPVLPLAVEDIHRIAVLGRLAAVANTGDRGSSMTRPPYVVTPLAGLQAAAGDKIEIDDYQGRDTTRAAAVARRSDVAVVVVGYTDREEGEYIKYLWLRKGGDRASLTLSDRDEALIQSVATANPRTVVVLMGGSAIITAGWHDLVPAILMAWYPGMEGGHALADLLLGRANPSAKLPCTFPRSAGQLPFFDRDAEQIEYGYFHGYRLLDHQGQTPAFPFGFGLSYTTFAYHDLAVEPAVAGVEGLIKVSVEVENRGPVAGEEVVQLYTGYPRAAVERPVRELKGFARVALQPGERRRLVLELPAARLARYDAGRKVWTVDPGAYAVWVGGSSAGPHLLPAEVRLQP
ncbi:MAG: glycoside hydrolase family 3 C-terminal domain-containing protein [Anaerolineae bacterium]